MKKLLIVGILMIVGSMLSFAEGKVFTICYHSVMGKEKVDLDFSKNDIKAQLEELKAKGFKFVTLQEVESGTITGNYNILVTMDDGYSSAYDAYKEVMKPMGIKPVFAIYPAIINTSKSYMKWEQVKELSDDGATIASHSYSHEQMNEKYFNKNPKAFEMQIVKSKSVLEEKLGKKVETFIYPYGIRSPVTIEHLKKAGYKNAFTINWGAVKVPLEGNKDVYELPRYMLTRKEWKNEFKIIYSGAAK